MTTKKDIINRSWKGHTITNELMKKINKDIRLLKKFFIKRFPKKIDAIKKGRFIIELMLWTDNSFTIRLSHGFQKRKKTIRYEIERDGDSITEKIIEIKHSTEKEKIIKEKDFVLKNKEINSI